MLLVLRLFAKKLQQIRFRKMMKRKINAFFLLIGFLAIIAAVLTIYYTNNSLYILKNGDTVYCPVVHIDYSAKGGNHAIVSLHGRELSAGKTALNVQLNDTIAVRYIEGETRVVQAENKIRGYYFYFVLEFILLILGIIIVIGGFLGKSMYDSYTHKEKVQKHR